MYMKDNDNTSRVEWGKEFKWGIVKRRELAGLRTPLDSQGRSFPLYHVVDHAAAVFAPEERRVAWNLTHEEASAMCAILNAGSNK